MKHLAKIFLAAFLCVNFANLKAQDFSLGGYTKFFVHPNLNSPYPLDKIGTRLQLKLEGSASDFVSFFSAVDFNWDLADPEYSQKMKIYPVESYVDISLEKFDIRLGNQFIFWGTTDWINPTDNINPWDYKNISAEIEDYRVPIVAARFDFYPSDFSSLQFVWLPVFQPNRIPLQLPSQMGAFKVKQESAVYPENKLSNSEFAFRFSSQFFFGDFSLSYFHGYDKNFSLFSKINPAAVPEIVFTPEYKKLDVFGGDFVTTFDNFALKGEAAYFRTEDNDGKNVFIENNHIKYVIGVDYNFSDDLSLNLQFIQNIRLNYEKSV